MTEVLAYIGLGSNLDQPRRQVSEAFEELAGLPRSRLEARSALYRSAPMGPQDQPDFINAVARLRTALGAEELLDELQRIERGHRREKTRHWGPRTLDLDILLYGDAVIESPRLRVPHPGIAQRNFVLYPLAELDAGLRIPGLGDLQSLLAASPDEGLTRLAEAGASAG